jgi:hypothetical protein
MRKQQDKPLSQPLQRSPYATIPGRSIFHFAEKFPVQEHNEVWREQKSRRRPSCLGPGGLRERPRGGSFIIAFFPMKL